MYLSCNCRFENFFGASEAEIIGKTDYDFVETKLADSYREHDRKAMEAGGPSINEELVTFATDGHQEYVETIKCPMFDADGHLIGVLGVGRNITERKQAEEALRESENHFINLANSGRALVRTSGLDKKCTF
jgi:PAS domain S-box-containing protein